MRAGRLTAPAEIGVAAGTVITTDNTGKHFEVTITGTSANATEKEKSRGPFCDCAGEATVACWLLAIIVIPLLCSVVRHVRPNRCMPE